MNKPISVTLDELGEVAASVASLSSGPVKVVAQVVGIVLEVGEQTVRVIEQAELERIMRERRLHQAAGAAAHEASKNAGPRR